MSCLRPATPGFVVTFTAAILLTIVSFCVPYLKSVFFLRASISQGGVNGSITFGTLGYCLELINGTTCSKPSFGYELDINSLVGNELPIQIPQVVVKWITSALAVLHIAALIVAAGSALFGLLAHVREMSMTCCSTFFSGFAAVLALVAFIFDLVLFFVAKARISSIGSAEIGSAVWLTLAAWVLLFFSGCFYSFGRRCISNRPLKKGKKGHGGNDYDSLDRETGVKAEEGGLRKFPEIEPLTSEPATTATIQGNKVLFDTPDQDTQPEHLHSGGYAQAPPGTSAMDEYNNHQKPSVTYPPRKPSVTYPPRKPSVLSVHVPYYNNVPQVPTPYPPFPTPDTYQNPGHFPAGPRISATGPGQRPNYLQDDIRSSPSPPNSYSSLLNRPSMLPTSNPSIPPNPYVIPPQQHVHRDDDYEVWGFQPPSNNPYVLHSSPNDLPPDYRSS